jgi:CheY-like chemotaxis protein/two-component sensor histidine kinase
LDLSRIISGKVKIEVQQLELGEIISGAIEVISPAAQAKEIDLEIFLEPDAIVSGDAARLRQVFWNLLSNAVKFTPKNGRVEIRLVRVNSNYEVTVSDTGRGIKAEFLPYVFERFRQADNAASTREGGLGLGMAITRNLLELHGGTIMVESAGENLGTTFTVRLPVTSVRRSESFAPPQNAGADNTDAHLNNSHNLQGLNILIVDDDHDGRYMMETLLSMYGAETLTAASVAEAFLKIETKTPDLVISDIEMPGEDGFSLIKKLTAFNENQKRKIPAVALTGHAGQEEKLKVLKAGFQVHLAKPIEPEELLVVIANLANWNNN